MNGEQSGLFLAAIPAPSDGTGLVALAVVVDVVIVLLVFNVAIMGPVIGVPSAEATVLVILIIDEFVVVLILAIAVVLVVVPCVPSAFC